MGVTRVTFLWQHMRAETEVDVDGAFGRLVHGYEVEFDAADAPGLRPVLALTASAGGVSVPAYWAELDGDWPYWYVKHKNPRPADSPFRWMVEVVYEYYDNPLVRPPQVSWQGRTVTEQIDRDADGAPLVNSADEPFDPAITEEFEDRILRVEFNVANFNATAYEDYIHAINGSDWTPAVVGRTFAAYTVKCLSISGRPERVGNVHYHHVTCEFEIRDDGIAEGGNPLGWRRRLLDQGFRTKDPAGYHTITDQEGNPLTHPVPLDGNGGKLNGGEPVFLVYTTKKTKDFHDILAAEA